MAWELLGAAQHEVFLQFESIAQILLPNLPSIAGAPTARATALGLGCGFGLGSAYQANQDLFHDLFGVNKPSSSA